ncbi:hypothetical protein EDD18DRAFT_1348763 [Armillaria luteobubalina]|uniref:Uncharacterized protein n=1 Tax=Armillaria luteobubalina TaxID=153913 RepID=A0AA39QCU3_9AGAR|nr:hypothetical protein EDD18DRAFT_1348763 [Armillaria luteobubalina]
MAQWPLPECAETIISNSPEDIAKRAEQDVHYQKRKRQIEARFNNNRGKARLAATSTATGKSLTDVSQEENNIFFAAAPPSPSRSDIFTTLNPLTHGQKLAIINKLTHETFQAETEDVKAEIFDALEQLREERAEASHKGLRKPEDYLDAIDAAPALLKRFLDDLAVQTGWWFTVIAGGPDPADGGNIRTGSFHVGVNGHKQNFEDEYTHHSVDLTDSNARRTTFEEGVIAPYGRFLKTLFSPETLWTRTNVRRLPEMSGLLLMPHSPASSPNPSLQPPSTLTQPPPDPGLISPAIPSPQPPLTATPTQSPPDLGVIFPSVPSLESSSTMSASIWTDSFLPPSTTSTSTSTQSPPDSGLVFPPISSFQLESMLQPSGSREELGGDELDPQLFWQDASFGGDYFSMGATERDRLAYDNLLGHAALDHEDESFPFTSGTMFGEVDAAGDGQVVLGIPGEQHPYPQLEPEESLLPLLPSHRDHIDEHETDADLPSPSSVPKTSFPTDFDGDLTPVRIRRKRHNRVANESEGRQEESGMVADGNEGRQEESTTVDEDAGEDHERRTSKRARKPPASRAVVAVGWLPSAVQYLTDSNLGSEWGDLLAAWQVLEAQISQSGSPTKGRLGAITSRPSSLSIWLQNRRYNVYPQLPPSFSVEFLAWWNALQPELATIRNRSLTCSKLRPFTQ